MNPYNALVDLNEPIDPTNVEFFKFMGLVPDAKVTLQEEPFDISKYPATVSLIAVSNKHGYYAAATTKGFTFGSTKSLRQAFYSAEKGGVVAIDKEATTVSLEKAVQQVRFSGDESLLLIGLEGGILSVYNVNDIKNNKEQSVPINSFNWNLNITDLRPNPEALPNLTAILFDNNQCKIIDITTGNTQCDLPAENVSAICWSPKGKQIVCGNFDGGLQHFDTNGVAKSELAIPEAMSAGHGEEKTNRYVQDVLWMENHIFLALYARKRESNEDEYVNDGYIINRKPASGATDPEYIRLAEITPIFTTEGRGNHFYMEVIRDLGKEIKHLVIIANAATTEVSVVGQNGQGEWATWTLPENGLAYLPLSSETSMDTYPLGLALDFTADEKLPSFDSGDDETAVDPMPVFYFINDEGHVGSYHCYNIELARRGEAYVPPSFTAATGAPAVATAATAPPPIATQTQTPSFSGFGSTSANNTSSFGDLLSGKNNSPAPASASSGFGGFGSFGAPSTGSIPSFSNLGSAQKIPATPAAGFTASKPTLEAAVPMFGSTTNIGFASNKPAFGAAVSDNDKPLSSFGGVATNPEQVVPEKKSTETSSSFSSMSLGQKSAEVPQSAFGSLAKTTATPTFGSTGFGSASTAPTSAFGSTSSKPATSAFGSTSTAPAVSSSFGSTSTVGGFGSLAKNTVPGAAAPTTTPAFGSTSTVGSFGSLAKNTTTPSFGSTATIGSGGFGSLAKSTVPGATAPTTTPAFGSTSTVGGFGSLAKNTVPGSTVPTFGSTATLGGGGFGSLAKNTVPGATAPITTPTFGSTATLGSGGFGSLAKKTVPGAVAPTSAPAFGSTATLGSGGFGSLAKNTVPGATSPASKPLFGAPTPLGSTSFGTPAQKTIPESTTSVSSAKPSETNVTSTSPATTTAKSPTTPTVTHVESKPAPVASKTTPATPVESKPPAESTPKPKEKLKPTAEEGMAREYESLYITVCEGIEELTLIHDKINKVMTTNTLSLGSKTEASLKDKNSLWDLNDVAEYGTLTQSIIESIAKDQANSIKMKESLQSLSVASKKSMDKKEDIKFVLGREFDDRVVDVMDRRELDAETKDVLNTIENKSEAYESTLNNLEFKLQEYKKRNKIKNDHNSGELTLYSLHRAIRDVQREIIGRNNDLTELEEKLANIKLNESRRQARQSPEGFSCEDLSDDEEEVEISSAVIRHTTRYIRRFNFLREVCSQARTRVPLECPVE